MKYQPKRSRKQWTEESPEYVLAVYDDGGNHIDRYTVLFGGSLWEPSMGRNVQSLGMSGNPTSPQGVSMWGSTPSWNRKALGKHIKWLDLPENIRKHVISRATED